ncbi:hypothetical protein QR680_010403 [Steinernema hermaphroditum]|uniref:Serpin domain-containing protein n=1 Tax=Steinernema hermaphroditum TaxID=289476 RepID=A0AA39MBH2_9BILA|nr:hypothetical protein QR680_010403 [Steinernema hermaphroditum]
MIESSDSSTEFFDRNTKPTPFYLPHEKTKEVNMMSMSKKRFHFRAEDDFNVLKMPFTGDHFSMFFVLPNEIRNISAFLSETDSLRLIKSMQSLSSTLLNARQISLMSTVLRIWLFPVLFKKPSLMCTKRASKRRLSLRQSVPGQGKRNEPQEFFADHPFLYLIVDGVTGCVVFAGMYT